MLRYIVAEVKKARKEWETLTAQFTVFKVAQ
jgi:hypothetical protein